MNDSTTIGKPFASLLDVIPPHLLATQSRSALVAACQDIDSLGLLDPQTHEVYLSETKVRNVLERVASARAAEGVLARLRAQPNQRLLNDQEARGKGATPIGMLALVGRVADFAPPSHPTYESLGLDGNSTEADAPAKMKKHFPDMTDIWFDTEHLKEILLNTLDAEQTITTPEAVTPEAEASGCDVLSCLWRHVPWWIAAAFITSVALYIAITGGAGALVIAAVIALGYGGSTITILGNCFMNPCW